MQFNNCFTSFDESIYFFLLSCTTFFLSCYIFSKTQNISFSKIKLFILITCGFSISFLFVILKIHNEQLPNILLYLSIPTVVSLLLNRKYTTNFCIGFISVCVFQILKILSAVMVLTIFWALGRTKKDLVIYLFVFLLTALLCVLFMKIKRIKKGIVFFQSGNRLGFGLCISGIVFVLTCISLRNLREYEVVFIIILFGVILSGFGLYLWIRRSITAHYREHLQLKTEEHYQRLLAESEEKNRQLSKSNEFLAKVVHRDNHIMSALNQSVDAYFQNGDKGFRDDLLREIQTLAKERGELIETEQRNLKILPSTSSLLIDSAIGDLYIKAAAKGIDFDLTVSAPLTEIIGKYISQTDVQTLICDHIKDAVIAVNAEDNIHGKILVTLSVNGGNYEISIFDNGVEFETDTLAKLGTERVTTHADSGGSGIGFMTTFETLRKSYASLIITEFENKTPFSKSVTFRFDGATSFIILSYRAEELRRAVNRSDVMILAKAT